MSETVTNPGSAQTADIPEAIVDRRRHRSSQLIWLIPVVALIIGLSLGIKAYLEKGPTITISFKSGEGIEEGKTKIKYKDVQIGLVRDVSISSDRSSVVVTAEIERDAAEFMKADTRFWVVRARITGIDYVPFAEHRNALVEIETPAGHREWLMLSDVTLAS